MAEARERSPGRLRRALHGAAHVPRGLAFLVRHPALWPSAAVPSLLTAVLLLAGVLLGFLVAGRLDDGAPETALPLWLAALIRTLVQMGVIAAGMVLGLALGLLVAAPLFDRLSRRVERLVRGTEVGTATSFAWEIGQSLRGGVYFLLSAPLVFLLALVPVVGPVLGLLWSAHALALQETDAPLARRGLDFRARRAWHRRLRAESLGFGFAGLVPALLFPCNLVFAPVLVPGLTVAATLFVLEREHA
jgi:CysZ protein